MIAIINNKILALTLFLSIVWLLVFTAYAYIDFDGVISFLSTYLSSDGNIERPKSAFLRVLFAPIIHLPPLVFLWMVASENYAKPHTKMPVFLPVFLLLFFGFYKYLDNSNSVYLAEDNLAEWFTFIISLIAALLFSGCAMMGNRFAIFLGLAWFVFAMEEISWGQRIFGFESPTFFLEFNYQQEFTLHNFFNPVMDLVYICVNTLLLFFLTTFQHMNWACKISHFSSIQLLLRLSDRYKLWVFPWVLVLLFIVSPPGSKPYEFVEQQWAIFGFFLAIIPLRELCTIRRLRGGL